MLARLCDSQYNLFMQCIAMVYAPMLQTSRCMQMTLLHTIYIYFLIDKRALLEVQEGAYSGTRFEVVKRGYKLGMSTEQF